MTQHHYHTIPVSEPHKGINCRMLAGAVEEAHNNGCAKGLNMCMNPWRIDTIQFKRRRDTGVIEMIIETEPP